MQYSGRPPLGSPGLLSRSTRSTAVQAGLVVPAGQRWVSRSRPNIHLEEIDTQLLAGLVNKKDFFQFFYIFLKKIENMWKNFSVN